VRGDDVKWMMGLKVLEEDDGFEWCEVVEVGLECLKSCSLKNRVRE